jgi:hypothetical protein
MIPVLSGRLTALALAAGFVAALALPVRAEPLPPPAPIWPTQQAEPADEADEADTPADQPTTADANDPDMKDIDVSSSTGANSIPMPRFWPRPRRRRQR